MADVRRIVDLYELHDSYKGVARELGISRNTVKKYIHRVKEVQEGTADEILPKDRKITQAPRVLTESVRQKIRQYLDSNLEHPRKQRLTAKRIWELLVRDGHTIGYTSVKDEVARWKRTNSPREVYILQEPREGQRAEFDRGEVLPSSQPHTVMLVIRTTEGQDSLDERYRLLATARHSNKADRLRGQALHGAQCGEAKGQEALANARGTMQPNQPYG